MKFSKRIKDVYYFKFKVIVKNFICLAEVSNLRPPVFLLSYDRLNTYEVVLKHNVFKKKINVFNKIKPLKITM